MQATARDNSASAATAGNLGGARRYQADGPDLLPIDEDVDDEHCSPIKPKKRTSEDSPFKRRNFDSIDDGNYEIKN